MEQVKMRTNECTAYDGNWLVSGACATQLTGDVL